MRELALQEQARIFEGVKGVEVRSLKPPPRLVSMIRDIRLFGRITRISGFPYAIHYFQNINKKVEVEEEPEDTYYSLKHRATLKVERHPQEGGDFAV